MPISSLPPEIQLKIFSFLPLQEALNTCVYLRAAQLPPVLSEKLIRHYHNFLSKSPSEKEIIEFYTKITIPDSLKDNIDHDTTTNLVLETIERKKLQAEEDPFSKFFKDVLGNAFTKDELQYASNQFNVFINDGFKHGLDSSVVKKFLCKLEELKENDPNYRDVPKYFKNLESLVLLNDKNLFGVEFFGLLIRCWNRRTHVYMLPAIKDCTFSNTFSIAVRFCNNMSSSLEVRDLYQKLFQHIWGNKQEITLDRAIWGNALEGLENAEITQPDENVLGAIRLREDRRGITIDKEVLHNALLFLQREEEFSLASGALEDSLGTIRMVFPELVIDQPVKITINQREIRGDSSVYVGLLKQIFPNGEIIIQES